MIQVGMLSSGLALVLVSTRVGYVGPEVRAIRLTEPNLQRHVYVPKLIVCSAILSLVIPWARSMLRTKTLRIVSLALLVAYLGVVNTQNSFLYQSSKVDGQRVREFVLEVARDLEREKAGQPFAASHILPRGGTWDIELALPRGAGDKVWRDE